MLYVFDTSILVAGFVDQHPFHDRAFGWIQKVRSGKVRWAVPLHSLVEFFSVMTRLPINPRIPAGAVMKLIDEEIRSSAQLIPLDDLDVWAALQNVNQLGFNGGVVYDALILQAAQKANADRLLTLNPRDFLRLLPKKPDFVTAA